MNAARAEDGDHGARCVLALFLGEDTVDAEAGAFLLAEAISKWMKTPTIVG